VILLAGGVFGVSTIDNILRPLIIGQHAQMPTLLIFFSILGGVEAFGAVGLIVGPLLVALLVGILDFTRARIQSQRAESPPG
jgi:predicted PurR-regulated permease PerM